MIYEDKLISIGLPKVPFTKGHLQIKTDKKLESLQQQDFSHLLSAGSFTSNILFELLKPHGTNIIVNVFDDEITCDVITRTQDDGLNLLWQPTRPSAQELDETAERIKDKCDYIDLKQEEKQEKPVIKEEKQEEKEKDSWEKEKNYLLKQLDRIP